ncbi:MAG: hypothetical protein P1U85_19990 [Verrucomicrobiales bacterium]|nr:hypothetical protein [Verrucomicrobiales bacterium]
MIDVAEQVPPYLDRKVQVVANLKPSKDGKAVPMVYLISIKL